jgi:transposase InsO family protein
MSAVEAVLEHGLPVADVSESFGPSQAAIKSWIAKYEEGGAAALVPKKRGRGGTRKPSRAAQHKKQAVLEVKGEHPEYGTRRIRDVLARFETLGVSETQVRRILHEEGLIDWKAGKSARQHPPRRFERSKPNEMWMSDIFTFLLRKHERLYMVGFMDDHSRYVVSHMLAHHQKSSLVMEALSRAVGAYGCPREILTDQGRQYAAWRGETDFQREVRTLGIVHVTSRPQHPQTLGKIERWWKTLWEEFLSRTIFVDFDDCMRRVKLFVDWYNFKRPSQALDGQVPADRFFLAAPQMREAVERNVAANARELSLQRPTRKPFYLVGRLGDKDLSIAAHGDEVHVQLGHEPPTSITLGKENKHEQGNDFAWGREAPPASAPDPAVDPRRQGHGRDGAAQGVDGAQRAERGGNGLGRHRAGEDLARDVLQARGAGAQGNDPQPPARLERDLGQRGAHGGEAHRGAAGQGGADGAREEATGEDREPGAEDRGQRLYDHEPRPEEELSQLLACLAHELGFDPEEGWRGRALRWERKLAGAQASLVDGGEEGSDGGEELDVHTGTQGAPVSDASIHDTDAGARRPGQQVGGSASPGPEPQAFAGPVSPADGVDHRVSPAEEGWPATDERYGEAPAGREPSPGEAQREAQQHRREAEGADRGDGPEHQEPSALSLPSWWPKRLGG